MLQALLHGKLSREIEGMEDVLTSSIFGILNNIPIEEGILPLLKTAIFIDNKPNPFKDINGFSMDIQFWPWVEEKGNYGCEPDVLIRLNTKGKSILILVEAKYRSGKSSYEDTSDNRSTDQLSREWLNLVELARKDNSIPYLIYLTADIAIPKKDMLDSLDELRRKSAHIVSEYPPQYMWLSWRHMRTLYRRSSNPFLQEVVLLLDRFNLIFYDGINNLNNYDLNAWNFSMPIVQFNWNSIRNTGIHWVYTI